MEQEVNVSKGKNLVCKHRNEISREIQNRLKEKVSLPTSEQRIHGAPHWNTDQADAVRRKTEERRYHKMAEAARKKEQEMQKKAEAEVTERLNKKTCLSGATIDWDVVQI